MRQYSNRIVPHNQTATVMAMTMAGEERLTVPRLVTFLSSLLQRIAESNDCRRQLGLQKVTVFHGLSRPAIGVGSYMERIFTYANCSPCCYVIAYIYLDRFVQQQPLIGIDSFNIHRLLITSVMVATKFMDDLCYDNAYFAKVGGISTLEMNLMERDFLFGLNFRLNVTVTVYQSYCSYLQREMCMEYPVSHLKSQCFFYSEVDDESNSHQQRKQLAL